MTGEKNRYTTTEKLWDFDDKTLKTPAHDEMVLWLLDTKNIEMILPSPIQIVPNKWKIYSFTVSGRDFTVDSDFINNFIHCELPPSDYITEIKNEWTLLKTEYNKILPLLIPSNKYYSIINKIKSEVPITANNGFLVGYTDIEIEWTGVLDKLLMFELSGYEPFPKTYIEVKPTIKSFGETLRQINTYKHYLETDQIYLFTTDLRFKEAFESRGIQVLTYPDQ